MSTEDKMNIDERRKYLRMMKKRYVQAKKKERRRLLDEMAAVTELHRKSLIRLMNGSLERKPRSKQRGRTYGPKVDDALRVIAESWDYICALVLYPVPFVPGPKDQGPVGPGQVRPSTGPSG